MRGLPSVRSFDSMLAFGNKTLAEPAGIIPDET